MIFASELLLLCLKAIHSYPLNIIQLRHNIGLLHGLVSIFVHQVRICILDPDNIPDCRAKWTYPRTNLNIFPCQFLQLNPLPLAKDLGNGLGLLPRPLILSMEQKRLPVVDEWLVLHDLES